MSSGQAKGVLEPVNVNFPVNYRETLSKALGSTALSTPGEDPVTASAGLVTSPETERVL